jgi:hypothetical protein
MEMNKKTGFALLLAAVVSFFLASSAFATTVSFDLTSPGSTVTGTNALDDVYVGAYTATINGVSTPVVCDDYTDESYVPEDWTAYVNTFSTLSDGQTKWGDNPTLYEEAFWLVEQMYNPANSSEVGELSFAIWGLFDSTALSDLQAYSTTDYGIAEYWLGEAQMSANYESVDTADFTIYTPDTTDSINCPGYSSCPSIPPQEFITYNASEPSVAAILGADLLLFGFALEVLRRRGVLQLVR